MVEQKPERKAKKEPPSLSHKDWRGRECSCLIGRDHHKNAKNEDCTCKAGVNHNTKSSPHKDGDERTCYGPFTYSRGAAGQRLCNWCRREETYSPVEIIVVFKKGVTDAQATEFLLGFSVDGHSPEISRDASKNIQEKKGIVAVHVHIPLASGKSCEEWVAELEKGEPVWFASRVMMTSFPNYLALPASADPSAEHRQGGRDFPDEFQRA